MRTRLIAPIALCVAAMVAIHADAQQLYRWVDKNGKINYTQEPPPKDAAKSVQQRRLTPSGGPADSNPQMPFAVRQAVDNFPVTLYTSTQCPRGCNEARALLNKRGVPFREVSVADEAGIESLKKMTGDTRVPVLLVGRQSEKGYEETAYNNILDSAGYPRTSSFTGNPPALPAVKPAAKPAAKPPAEAPAPGAEATPGATAAPGAPEGNQAPAGR
ncbi:MAG: glutaredoxin family protein [Burkholderiales bacterium]